MKNSKLNALQKDDIKTLVLSLQRLVPGFISLENDIISLQAKPEKILTAIHHVTTTDIPPEFREAYLKAFEVK